MADLPGSPQQTPGFPSNPLPVPFESFTTVNTKPSRPGIKDDEMFWCDGWMPLGPNNLRTLYDVGTSIYTAVGTTITFFGFGNCGQTAADQHAGAPLMIVVLANGQVVQVNTSTGVATTMAAAGTITSTSIGMAQSGNSFIILVADQTNGYFLWDGVNFFKAGTLAPDIEITNVGSGYTSAPAVTFTGGAGAGAAATAVIENGQVINVYMTNPGSGYVIGNTVTVGFVGGGGAGAAATVKIMPFGIKGTSVETYVSQVWVADFDKITFSAPGSVSNFAEADGGGVFESNDPFLRVGYKSLKQSNGFLFLLGDSSVNHISGVSTSGTPPATTFSNQNVDPQIGTPYPGSVQVFSRNIVFANSLGVHVLYGGSVTKVSGPMDGVYNTVANFGGANLYSAVANIFGIAVYMCLVPIIDPYTNQQVNKLLMWDGRKWWASGQSVSLTMIASQEINSVLTAWGSTGTKIYPLFQNSSALFRKVVRSKLWPNPWYFFTKTAKYVFGVVEFFEQTDDLLEISVDSELGASPSIAATVGNTITFYNSSEQVISFLNSSESPIAFFTSGLVVFGQAVGQNGHLIGLTASTLAPDLGIVSLTVVNQTFSPNL